MAGARYAVLVASSTFPNEPRLQPLTASEKDVDGLKAVLLSPDRGCFSEVKVLKNQPHYEIASHIHRVFKLAKKDDLVVVYYSGHGKLNQSGQLYLTASDTNLDELESSAVGVVRIRDFLEGSQSKQVVIILDCCFSGAINGVFSKSSFDDQLSVEASKARGTYIMTASTAIQTALQKEGDQYSVFTKHLITGIDTGEADTNRNGVITVEELYEYLYPRVCEESHQEPTRWNVDTRGHLVIANSGRHPRKEREKELRDLLFNLSREQRISDEVLTEALALINRSAESLSATEKVRDALLDDLHDEKIGPVSFLLKWVQLTSSQEAKGAAKDSSAETFTRETASPKQEEIGPDDHRKAAERGQAAAQNSLVPMHPRGESMSRNVATDVEWYRRAAKQRHDVLRLAKLTRPQVSGTVTRLRLFKLLDDAATTPLIWVQGPPGAGKTTLVASYLTAKNISGIWYQIDRDDADLASFFYYLGLAAPSRGRHKRGPMPPLAPEYLLDIEGFARRFFRELYSRLGDNAVLVFDNYQEVAASSTFHKMMACGLAEVPPGMHVIVLSRTEPSPEYARHLANNLIAHLCWDDLRLTLDETSLIATARQSVDAEILQSLHAQSDGWAAGLVLMLEQLKQSGTVSRSGQNETLDSIFNYFAKEIFERLNGETRDFLIRTCLLPQVTAELASELTGRLDAANMLAKLHQRQLFIDRRVGAALTYQYHALFLRFLQAQAKSCFTKSEYQALMVASAEALASQGQIEKAVPLFVMAQAWQPAIQLIVTQAKALLALGRWQTVQQWIESLPPESIRNTTPWLGFWLGMCRLGVDPVKARFDLEPAFAFFEETGDILGQVLAATAIIEAHMVEWVDYRRLDPWIESLEAFLSRRNAIFPSLNTELTVRAGLFAAVLLRQTYRGDIPHLARQLGDMLRHDLDPNYKLLAARGIYFYGAYSGDFVLIDQVISYTESAFYSPAATALNRAWYATSLGYALRYVKDSREKARGWFRRAREIVREHGLRFIEAPIATYCAWAEEVFGEIADIERELRIVETHFNPQSGFEAAFRHIGIVFLRARQNDLDAALAHVCETFPFLQQSGYRLGQLAAYIALTGVRLRGNDFVGAREALDQALTLFFPCPLRSYVDGMFSAGIALGMKDEEQAQTKLRAALNLGAKHGLENTLSEHLFHPMTASLCAYALNYDIETDYAKRIIRAQRLSVPSADMEE